MGLGQAGRRVPQWQEWASIQKVYQPQVLVQGCQTDHRSQAVHQRPGQVQAGQRQEQGWAHQKGFQWALEMALQTNQLLLAQELRKLGQVQAGQKREQEWALQIGLQSAQEQAHQTNHLLQVQELQGPQRLVQVPVGQRQE
mmetsp:Transcript_49575/g.105353  ORF Transcript_49575/g.105353 Transcript_49575/m.105353 type:complete len:141 (-) Transcript_49575:752-1174(-)